MRGGTFAGAGLVLFAAAAAACDLGGAAAPTFGGGEGEDVPRASEAVADVGSATIHRLNAFEYDNTVRDLLGDVGHPASAFPPDDGEGSFTNNADSLTTSPLLFEKYEAAAEALAKRAATEAEVAWCNDGTCRAAILARFARRAWRRPVTSDELARLVAVAASGDDQDVPFAQATAMGIEAVLLSPHFLFRIERDPVPMAHPLTDHELASRLSYFLWSSMPDAALSVDADAGRLSDPATFRAHVQRMLADPKAGALLDGFAMPWLVHALDTAAPDKTLFPTFNEDVRRAMAGETRAFLSTFLFDGLPFVDMIDAPFTFVDSRMAKHYGVDGVTGTTFVRVDLPAKTHRVGILGHASILTMTSVPTRTSPVRRGEWVLAELLCAPPPPPPPDIPALEAEITVGTMRQRMEAHRKNPVCASCHDRMDPVGLALEHFDALGRWRATDAGQPIDTTGQLPSGDAVDGLPSLAKAIKADPRFPACTVRKMLTYALGRTLGEHDAARIDALTERFAASHHDMRALVTDIVHDDAFRMRRPNHGAP